MPPLPPPNPYIAGAAVGGERGFFGREDTLSKVGQTLRHLEDKTIVLYGQRRIGKTSILLQLQRRLPAQDYFPIYFDLMDKARLPIGKVLYELAVTIADGVGLPHLSRADFEEDPEAFFHHTFLPAVYRKLRKGQSLVLLLDEFDVLDLAGEPDLPETAAARTFCPYLRRLLTPSSRLLAPKPPLAFVFVVGRRMEELSGESLPTFKAAPRLSVSVLPPEKARALVLLGEREGTLRYEESAVARILALTRGHPYLTQLTCQLLFDRAFEPSPKGVPLVTAEDVEAAAPAVLEMGGNALQWIWDGLPPAERIIFSAIASRAQEGAVFCEDDISAVLEGAGIRILVEELNLAPKTLVNWQMLEEVDGGYRFFIELMRRWVAEHWPLDRVKDELDRLVPWADNLYQTAQGFYRQGNNEQAITQLRHALEANPNHLKARLLLGTILREEGQLVEAAAQFEEACRLDEREGRFELLRTLLKLGESLETTGNEDDEDAALMAYDRMLRISPNEGAAQQKRSAIWIRRGEAALKQDELEKALRAFQEANDLARVEEVHQKIRKRELAVQVQAADRRESEENWEAAIAVYEAIIQEYPDESEPQARLERATSQARMAQLYNEALGALETGNVEVARSKLAMVIAQEPGYKEAARYLLQALTGVNAVELRQQLIKEHEENLAARGQIESLQASLAEAQKKCQELEDQIAALQPVEAGPPLPFWLKLALLIVGLLTGAAVYIIFFYVWLILAVFLVTIFKIPTSDLTMPVFAIVGWVGWIFPAFRAGAQMAQKTSTWMSKFIERRHEQA
jgi:tetratricopeptide (TPR) repeat protein